MILLSLIAEFIIDIYAYKGFGNVRSHIVLSAISCPVGYGREASFW